jgi:hypothetical protein
VDCLSRGIDPIGELIQIGLDAVCIVVPHFLGIAIVNVDIGIASILDSSLVNGLSSADVVIYLETELYQLLGSSKKVLLGDVAVVRVPGVPA